MTEVALFRLVLWWFLNFYVKFLDFLDFYIFVDVYKFLGLYIFVLCIVCFFRFM